MKLYLISQSENGGYDTYDSAVVVAESEERARMMHPSDGKIYPWPSWSNAWATKPENISVDYLGEAKEPSAECVVIASFNAG